MYEAEVLKLSPTSRLDPVALAAYLDGVPGAFRDPHERDTWILPSIPSHAAELRALRIADPSRFPDETRVTLTAGSEVLVVNGRTTGALGRAQAFVRWLLAHGPCDLDVRGQLVGRVVGSEEIYDQAWDAVSPRDLTRSPPPAGRLVTWAREAESLAVHDSGVVAYDAGRTVYRHLSPLLRAGWADVLRGLPLDADQHDRHESYIDPVVVTLSGPEGILAAVKLDAARPLPEYAELLAMLGRWARALGDDPDAVPEGLVE